MKKSILVVGMLSLLLVGCVGSQTRISDCPTFPWPSETVEKMTQVERELNPRLINRNINSLCVKKDILTDENKAKYTIWGRAV